MSVRNEEADEEVWTNSAGVCHRALVALSLSWEDLVNTLASLVAAAAVCLASLTCDLQSYPLF